MGFLGHEFSQKQGRSDHYHDGNGNAHKTMNVIKLPLRTQAYGRNRNH